MLVLKKKGYFGRVLKGLRIREGLLLRDIAGCLGKSIPYVSDIEKGHRNPLPFEMILKLSSAFNFPGDVLLKAAIVERGFIPVSLEALSQKEIDIYILGLMSRAMPKAANE